MKHLKKEMCKEVKRAEREINVLQKETTICDN